MKYPIYIKLKKDGKVLKAITYLGMSDCYDCRYKGKRELISVCEPVLYSRDKKNWLTWEELKELDYPKIEYPVGSMMYYIDKYLAEGFDKAFKTACKEENKDEQRIRNN